MEVGKKIMTIDFSHVNASSKNQDLFTFQAFCFYSEFTFYSLNNHIPKFHAVSISKSAFIKRDYNILLTPHNMIKNCGQPVK